MRITVEVLLSLFLIGGSLGYFLYRKREGSNKEEIIEGKTSEKITAKEKPSEEIISEGKTEKLRARDLIKDNKKLILYHMVMFLLLIGLIVLFHTVYKERTMVSGIKLMMLVAGLGMLAWTDFHEYRIPNNILLVLLGIRMVLYVWEFIVYGQDFFQIAKDGITALVLIGLFLLAVHFTFRNSIGMGDIKLLMIMALYQGFAGVFSSVFFSLLVTCFLSIGLLIGKKIGRKDSVPFAPSVLIGTYLSIILTGI